MIEIWIGGGGDTSGVLSHTSDNFFIIKIGCIILFFFLNSNGYDFQNLTLFNMYKQNVREIEKEMSLTEIY